MYYAIDRLEGDIAVLIDDEEGCIEVGRDRLPDSVREGDVLYMSDGRYCLDEAETAARRERIRRLEEKLRRK